MPKRIGRSSFLLESCPVVLANAAVAGKKEGEGPLGADFDLIEEDTSFGEDTWEKAESRMQQQAVQKALMKAKLTPADINLIFAGDLLNQCVGSSYGLRDFEIPIVGLYGACSTMAESLCMAGLFVDSGMIEHAVAVTSSHFCSAERQFRFPLEYGGQRPPSAQWTATASGAAVVGKKEGREGNAYLRTVTIGKIADLGITDANNMGAAMAPAAASTIATYLKDSGTKPADYDLILTGDLGTVGRDLLFDLLEREKICISDQHNDCGLLLYDRDAQDVHAGGSGCGCSAGVLCAKILGNVRNGQYQNILFIATGALMSPTIVQQGESIPGIAHLVHISSEKTWKEGC